MHVGTFKKMIVDCNNGVVTLTGWGQKKVFVISRNKKLDVMRWA